MKQSIFILLIVFLTFSIISAEESINYSNIVKNASNLILSIKKSIGTKTIATFPEVPLSGLFQTDKNFTQLISIVNQNTDIISENFTHIASDRESRILLIHSMLYLSPSEYINVVPHLLSLFKNNIIGKDEFLYTILMPPVKNKQWFLSYNYEHPQVVSFLDDVKSAFAEEKHIPELIDFIKNGGARKRDEILRSQNLSLAKRQIPFLVSTSDNKESYVQKEKLIATRPAQSNLLNKTQETENKSISNSRVREPTTKENIEYTRIVPYIALLFCVITLVAFGWIWIRRKT